MMYLKDAHVPDERLPTQGRRRSVSSCSRARFTMQAATPCRAQEQGSRFGSQLIRGTDLPSWDVCFELGGG